MGLQMFVVSSSMIALTSLVNRFGSQETAAFSAALQLWNYIQMPALAISAAVIVDGGAEQSAPASGIAWRKSR